jgi:L,D-peptidoglycan transpeptidase YkuD (ErfK/YbiS/YcfS/YnhG family)
MKPTSLLLFIASLSSLHFCSASMAMAQSSSQQPMQESTQMVVVTTPDWNAVAGRLQRYVRSSPGKPWTRAGDPIAIVVGRNGTGWGAGVLPTDDPATRAPQDPVKKEGDGKSPAGVFRISAAFGYAAQPLPGWRMTYISLTPSVDSASHFYNRIVDRATVSPDWQSSEHMSRAGDAYRWGAVIDQNATAVPNGGSCVFMHIWASATVGTSGCTAMPQDQLEPILAWLDPARNPLLVQLPLTQYEKLKKIWQLP